MQAALGLFARRYPLIYDLLTARRSLSLAAVAAIVCATSLAMFAHAVATSDDYVTIYGPVIGGDFVVFDEAASAAARGEAAALYEADGLSSRIAEAFPSAGKLGLSWQYPPTMLLVLAPLSIPPYLASFALWVAATGGLMFCVLRNIWNDRLALFLAISSPAAFLSMATGQTGFLTGALLGAIGLWSGRRPALAGAAAGLLAVKPQLGLLIPVALAARGHWRAFAAAGAVILGVAAASALAFGLESWTAFVDAVIEHGGRMQSDIFPYYKLITPFGAAKVLGFSTVTAVAAQAAAIICLAGFVAIVWRRVEAVEVRLAVLSAAAPLATPYAFFYEAALFIPALLALARRGTTAGWLLGERPALLALWVGPIMLPGSDDSVFPLGFALAAGAFLLAARRAVAEGALRAPAPTAAR